MANARRAIDRRFCVAPMMDRTDRHHRYLLRLISRHAVLYTEMVTTAALLGSERARLLDFHPREHPVALQVGGSEPVAMAECARIAEAYGYDEININVGCPSERVQSGRFGACLLAEPARVARCVEAMGRASDLPVTVKTRIGVDELDAYEALHGFVRTVADAGCKTFIVHARKAWLRGLSPRENRSVPPLRYDVVRRLKRDFRHLEIVVNGGIIDLGAARRHLAYADGVMVGRAAYSNPYLLAEVDHRIFGDPHPVPSRAETARAYAHYIEQRLAEGAPLACMTRHLLGLFQGLPGARRWRRHFSERAHRPGAGAEIVQGALALVNRVPPRRAA